MGGLAGFVALLSRPIGAIEDKSVAARGDDDDPADKAEADDDETLALKAAKRFPQPVAVGALIHRWVFQPLESQPILGMVAAIVRGPDRSISAVIDYGGVFGFGTRRIAVPIDAMALLSPDLEVVDFEPDELSKFPTFDLRGSVTLAPDAIIRVCLAKPPH